jgi:hypothetical protein
MLRVAMMRVTLLLRSASFPLERIKPMQAQVEKVVTAHVAASVSGVKDFVTTQQRDANRSLQPEIQSRMTTGYTQVLSQPGGPGELYYLLHSCHIACCSGVFNRMKEAMLSHASGSLDTIFNQACKQLMTKVETLVEAVGLKLEQITPSCVDKMRAVYCVCWEQVAD